MTDRLVPSVSLLLCVPPCKTKNQNYVRICIIRCSLKLELVEDNKLQTNMGGAPPSIELVLDGLVKTKPTMRHRLVVMQFKSSLCDAFAKLYKRNLIE